MKKLSNLLDKFEFAVCVVLITVLLIVSTSSVLSRYVLPTPLAWSEELSRFLFMWLVFFTCSYAVRTKASLAIDFIPTMVLKNKPLACKILRILNDIGFLAFCAFMIWRGVPSALKSVEFSSTLHIPMKLVYMCMPVGSVMISIRLLQDIIMAVTGTDTDDGADSLPLE